MRGKQLYEGKAKVLFEGPEAGTLIQYFKDDATAFNNQKKGTISGKGILNNCISEYIMLRLAELGIPTHFIKRLDDREQLIKSVEIVPLEVVVRNIAAGSICKNLGLVEGTPLSESLVEFCYKKDELGDPLISRDHAVVLGWATQDEIEDILHYTHRINDFLRGLFFGIGVRLVDFKIEFGRLQDDLGTMIVLADEISPDSCRLWDVKTNEKMDKDRFRRDLGAVEEAYIEIARRLGVLPESFAEKNPA
ncbi:phosphoribosylaminoimidazolesuccinocarboxamide synthase [Kiloniella laminariae]|uniref:phosphoribosylaminoimidazolesuccinocarboxamide synthase n=1 Tax=Kiloniella laminariae TaxID=454162 RepID=UPI0003828A2F|nr:phosphoribosylaminoimidazolesuccinocarboxamide synthase [Kiloniella laminariae]